MEIRVVGDLPRLFSGAGTFSMEGAQLHPLFCQMSWGSLLFSYSKFFMDDFFNARHGNSLAVFPKACGVG